MPTVIDSLVVTLGLNAKEFDQGQQKVVAALDNVRRQAKDTDTTFKRTEEGGRRTAQTMSSQGNVAAEYFGKIHKAAAGFLALVIGGKLTETIKETAYNLAALGRSSVNIGVNVPQLAAFRNAIAANGGSADAAAASFQKLADSMAELQATGKTAIMPGLQAVGANLQGSAMDTYMAFVRYVERNKLSPQQARFYGGQLNLDEGSINLAMKGTVAVAKELAEATKRGVPTAEMTERATKLQHAWEGLSQAMGHLIDIAVDRFAPALTKILTMITEFIEKHPALAGMISGAATGAATGGAAGAMVGGPAGAAVGAVGGAVVGGIVGGVGSGAHGDNSYAGTGAAEGPPGVGGRPPGAQGTQGGTQGLPTGSGGDPTANNPLDLMYLAGQPFGAQPPKPGSRWGRYPTIEDGIAAAARQMMINQDGPRQDKTLTELIRRWAPPHENDTTGYIARVAKGVGIANPNMPIDVHDPNVLRSLIREQAKVEGQNKLTEEQINEGVNRALRAQGQQTSANMIRGLPVAAQRTQLARNDNALGGGSGQTVHVNGPITINTQATDARGIARDLRRELAGGRMVAQANTGLA